MKEKILLHICCGPCSTHPATLLSESYKVIGYFYNPNIWPYNEWVKRYEAFKKFCEENNSISDYFPKFSYTEDEYNKNHYIYLERVRGYEHEEEGGARCPICFKLRIEEVGRFAKDKDIKIFATTLTLGSNKHPDIINPIGQIFADRYNISFYEANWKKQDGALKGKKISDEHGLYRQHYCGCEFSL